LEIKKIRYLKNNSIFALTHGRKSISLSSALQKSTFALFKLILTDLMCLDIEVEDKRGGKCYTNSGAKTIDNADILLKGHHHLKSPRKRRESKKSIQAQFIEGIQFFVRRQIIQDELSIFVASIAKELSSHNIHYDRLEVRDGPVD